MTATATAWRFRVRCRKGEQWYYRVTVVSTAAEMVKYDEAMGPGARSRLQQDERLRAKTYHYSSRTRPSRYCIGEMLFNREKLEFEYVAHEAAHAALRWAKVDKSRSDGLFWGKREPEEAVCGVVGRLTQCIIVRTQRLAKKEKRRR